MTDRILTALDEHLDPHTAPIQGIGGNPSNPLMQCRCKRIVPADMMVDVRLAPGIRADFICDGCFQRYQAKGNLPAEQLKTTSITQKTLPE